MSRYLVAPLSSTRSLLSLHGADAAKFLQGLVSNNVGSSNEASIRDRAVYAGVFSAQGRLLHDTFILRDPSIAGSDGNGFIVDYPSRVTQPPLLPHLKRFILRSKVKARDINPDWRLWAVFQDPLDRSQPKTTIEEEVQHIATSSKGRWWRDCRNSRMGYRLLLPPSASSAIESASFSSATPSIYTLLRTINNVPETPFDLPPNVALPLESNLDVMGGIDFRKGCYIGQELTARTWHTGVIRKRVMPVRLYRGTESPPESLLPASWTSISSVSELPLSDIDISPSSSSSTPEVSTTRSRRARSAGKLASAIKVSSGNEDIYLGLALLRLELTDGELEMSVESTSTASQEGTETATAGESGVNAAGGMLKPESISEDLVGEWKVKAFKETLAGAK